MIDRKKIQLNLIGGPSLPNCPSMIRLVSTRILEMLQEDGYFDYQKITEANMWLIAAYWKRFDGYHNQVDFEHWMKRSATDPELITRARRWLANEGFIRMKEGVRDEAKMAQDRWARGFQGR